MSVGLTNSTRMINKSDLLVSEGEHFKLNDEFLARFKNKKPQFGFNGLGEFVFYRTYSRIKEDGGKETFLEVIQRVVEGCYEIQRRHCNQLHIPWDYSKALASAEEMFERMWDFKFLPPGRGLWMMGTKFMWERGSAALNNCAFISTCLLSESDPAEPYCYLMDMSMLGVGVGFDTKGADKTVVHQPASDPILHVVDDSREGWVASVRALLRSYLTSDCNNGFIQFDYSKIRPAGTEIKGFGGKASGPKILMELHDLIRGHLDRKVGGTLNSVDITDIMNYIGRCVVAGNIRRSSEIAFGEPDDVEYCSMKNPTRDLTPDETQEWYRVINAIYADNRGSATLEDFADSTIPKHKLKHAISTFNSLNNHRWASNNSIFAKVGMDYTAIGAQIGANGEPGLLWLDAARDYGRIVDGRQPGIDGRVMGSNPCFSGNMRLFTSDGYVSLYDLWQNHGALEYDGLGDDPLNKYGSQSIVNRNGLVESTKVYRTGCDVDLWRVTFDDNSFIEATANHNFIVLNRKSVRIDGKKRVKYSENRVHLQDLNVGDMIPLNQTVHFGTFADSAYAELAGWCIGDGSLSPQIDGQLRAFCTCYDEDVQSVLPRLRGLMLELYGSHNKSSCQSPVYAGWNREQDFFDHDEVRIGSNVLGRLLRSDGALSGDKHHVPNSIWGGTRETVAAFLRGFASADGGVQVSDNGSVSVRIWQSNRDLLSDCRLLLNQFGIASSVKFRCDAGKQLMNDCKGDQKLYNRKDGWELIISGMKQVRKFIDNIGFIQNSKMAKAREWLNSHSGSNNSDTGKYVKIKSVEYVGKGDTFCLTEPGNNQVVVEGYEVGQCVEQSLESGEMCVSGDTKLQLKDSVVAIVDLVGKSVEIWNGNDWSVVTPRVTGYNRKLYRVHLSDGSYLDTTANHGWSVKKPRRRANAFRRVETQDLVVGYHVHEFELGSISGVSEPYAFELGYVTGDGYLAKEYHNQNTGYHKKAYPMAVACGPKAELREYDMNGKWTKPQIRQGYTDPVNRINLQACMTTDQLVQLRDKESGLPSWVMSFDRGSILQFIAGWIEADGCVVREENTHGYRIYGLEKKIRDAQLLLRRIGINHASVNFCHPAGQETNKGIRKHDLWYIQIPSYESAEIPTRVKKAEKIGKRYKPNPRYKQSLIDMAKKQKIEFIEELPGLHTTYCFDEPINHMGVFGNSITYQCNLVETFPTNHEDADDYMRTLKFAYLYAKTVTLLPTHNRRTNQVMLRNRRIGLSQSGIVQAFKQFGRRAVLRDFCDAGYNEIRRWDQIYSDWLCVPKSIKVTSVKPSGTVSIVVGVAPGIHHPEGDTYWRTVRVAKNSEWLSILMMSGYKIEPSVTDPETMVVYFGVNDKRVRPVDQVNMWEQMQNVADYQKYWADNQVSCTIKFKAHEAAEIPLLLSAYEDQLKGISFLPHMNHGFAQAPYIPCTEQEVIEYNKRIIDLDYSSYLEDATGSVFCDNDKCTR